ncbi:hypothetical protein Mapa_010472 [Marchantia paleacea]|nr:hypothetical protein Mapa_010472 [Marchantia paleacea]
MSPTIAAAINPWSCQILLEHLAHLFALLSSSRPRVRESASAASPPPICCQPPFNVSPALRPPPTSPLPLPLLLLDAARFRSPVSGRPPTLDSLPANSTLVSVLRTQSTHRRHLTSPAKIVLFPPSLIRCCPVPSPDFPSFFNAPDGPVDHPPSAAAGRLALDPSLDSGGARETTQYQ